MAFYADRIRRKIVRARLRPIKVFCFHQVSAVFDPDTFCKPDWIPLSFLKNLIYRLRIEGYEFISLESAYNHIHNDLFRKNKYVVLTADDGLLCQLDLIPFLEAEGIPLTLFVNIQTLNGRTCGSQITSFFNINSEEEERILAEKLYFNKEQLFSINSRMISIGMHGADHEAVDHLSRSEFKLQLDRCLTCLRSHPCFIPFFAYTFGRYSLTTNRVLHENGVVPVLADGQMNYNDSSQIHRLVAETYFQDTRVSL